jgi:hypothetical protein
MMFAKAGIIALAIGAGLVGVVSFANAQIAVVNEKFNAFKEASLGRQVDFGGALRQVGGVLGNVNGLENLLEVRYLPHTGDTANLDAHIAFIVDQLDGAVKRRDEAAKELATAIDETMDKMKTMNPVNQQDAKRLEQIFDGIQAINKTTNDALLRLSDSRALLEEQAATRATKQ